MDVLYDFQPIQVGRMVEMGTNIEGRAVDKTGKKVELNANYKEEIWLMLESEIWHIAGKLHYSIGSFSNQSLTFTIQAQCILKKIEGTRYVKKFNNWR